MGANYIKDEVYFVTADVDDDADNNVYSSFRGNIAQGREADDPVYFRSSVFDFTPMRYNGENLAILARPSFTDLGDFEKNVGDNSGDFYIARSGHKDVDLWYRGFYGLYQGKYFNARLHLIGGIRHDQYQVKEKERLIAIGHDRETDVWQGTRWPVTPWFVGYGDSDYRRPEGIPDSLNANVQDSYDLLREYEPDGTVDLNFPDYQKFTTGTFGASFRIMDPVSVYFMYSEGVFPNTGQRDGNYQPIEAETTTNKEIGFKFDLLDGKISGTISVYEINRENAVFYWGDAPAPSKWLGGPEGPVSRANGNYFSPQAALGPDSGYMNDIHRPLTYGVALEYIQQAYEEAGIEWVDPGNDANFFDNKFFPLPEYEQERAISEISEREVENGIVDIKIFRKWLYVPYSFIKDDPNGTVLRRAFELAMLSNDPVGFPLHFQGGTDLQNNNVSNRSSRGANVLYEERGRGIDGQFIFSPIDNYQIIFTFSHQEREVVGSGFKMVDLLYEDPASGEVINFGTEFDRWTYILGVENFEDPTRPSTFTGEGVNGLDLSFVPQTSLNLWNKYRFAEGPLQGLEVGGGVRYQSSTPTDIVIGGEHLTENRYLAPDRPERWEVDAMLSYRFDLFGTTWRASLRISNLLNKQGDILEYVYDNPFGGTETRRTEVYYGSRSFRLSLKTNF